MNDLIQSIKLSIEVYEKFGITALIVISSVLFFWLTHRYIFRVFRNILEYFKRKNQTCGSINLQQDHSAVLSKTVDDFKIQLNFIKRNYIENVAIFNNTTGEFKKGKTLLFKDLVKVEIKNTIAFLEGLKKETTPNGYDLYNIVINHLTTMMKNNQNDWEDLGIPKAIIGRYLNNCSLNPDSLLKEIELICMSPDFISNKQRISAILFLVVLSVRISLEYKKQLFANLNGQLKDYTYKEETL